MMTSFRKALIAGGVVIVLSAGPGGSWAQDQQASAQQQTQQATAFTAMSNAGMPPGAILNTGQFPGFGAALPGGQGVLLPGLVPRDGQPQVKKVYRYDIRRDPAKAIELPRRLFNNIPKRRM
ncbi:MAG: hypothetical protein HY370_07050 [Proteobacteria bacterium]|nr:hypothetical protein [Pseudomonadota bacterium]